MDKPTIFISYSHKDEEWKDRLVTHFGVLEQQGMLRLWDDRMIAAGTDWLKEIETALEESKAAVLMITADFLASKFIMFTEVPALFKKHAKQGLIIIPLIVRPCAWKQVGWLNSLSVLPRDGVPLSAGSEHEIDANLAAFVEKASALPTTASLTITDALGTFIPPHKIFTAKLPVTGKDLLGREQEMDILDHAWNDEQTSIISLVAFGGVGKSALVNHWLNRMGGDNFRGATRVYGWSFYSQGVSENRQTAVDDFFNSTLRWFGDPDPTQGSAWGKGVRLAELIRKERTLLILDGLEPLQYPAGEMQGRLKDQGFKAMLKELARSNPGLCVITTRVMVRDLENYFDASVRHISLENLTSEAGATLLEKLGVKGTRHEIQEAAREFKGHALALNLLGRYLDVVHDGDVRKRDLIPKLSEEEQKGGHAKRVMESYVRWLVEKPELDILRMMGLFDRPVEQGALNTLRAKPLIEGLTEALQDITTPKWKFALRNLRDLKLLSEKDINHTNQHEEVLDCHPLVREHFGQKLRNENPEAWKEAHGRLYEYYKNLPEKELPDTLEEMAPLFAAVAHGCNAGLHEEVIENIYIPRICRGRRSYLRDTLMAVSTELALLSNFFKIHWHSVLDNVKDKNDQGLILRDAGLDLRLLGRLQEAETSFKAALKVFEEISNEMMLTNVVRHSIQLYISMGKLSEAIELRQKLLKLTSILDISFEKIAALTTVADLFHQTGEMERAKIEFEEAEREQEKLEPNRPRLYRLAGYRYWDLLLSLGKYDKVIDLSHEVIDWEPQKRFRLGYALADLARGRAHLYKDWKKRRTEFPEASTHLEMAMEILREAGQQEFIVRGLFARAELYRSQVDFFKAAADLEEALEIVELSGMEILKADYHLGAAHLNIDRGRKKEAENHLEKADSIIKGMGYHRRDSAVKELKRLLANLDLQNASLDPLELAFRLVAARRAPVDLLLRLNSREVLDAVHRMNLESKIEVNILHVQETLREQQPGIEPNPLWMSWMEATQGDKIVRLKEELVS